MLDLETSNTGCRCQKKTASGREIFRGRTSEPVERLLVLGADVNAGGRMQKTPVEISGQSGRLAVVAMLPRNRADLNHGIRHDGDLVNEAAYWESPGILQVFPDRGLRADDVPSRWKDSTAFSLMENCERSEPAPR